VTGAREPRVTAVIPTTGRPTLPKAVAGALAQRGCDPTVSIVADGVSVAEVRARLGPLAADERVEVRIVPAPRGGASAARNFGVEHATTEWIAFCDDDDYWFPGKLAAQLALAPAGEARVVLSHRFVARTPERDFVWPRAFPEDAAHLSEYLFCRRGWFDGDGHLQTSTLLVPRALALECPFREDLRRHQDHDWVLRCVHDAGARIVMAPEPLSVYVMGQAGGETIGARGCWRERLEWARANRHLFSDRGYAGFVTGYGAFAAGLDRDRRALPVLVAEALRHGRPRPRDLLVATALATIPPTARRRARAIVSGPRRRAPAAR
jgi:glycosyltransferase involved in cell wall biosynthesis